MRHEDRFLKRWAVLALLVAALVAVSAVGWQSRLSGTRPKTHVAVGIVNPNPAWEPTVQGIKSSMAAQGYREGESVRFVYAGPLPRVGQVDEEARRLVGNKVDLIVSVTTPASLAAKRAVLGTAIPVVFAPVTNAIEAGLASSLHSPGKNATGIQVGGTAAKALEWLQVVRPTIFKILVFHDSADASSVAALDELTRVAARLRISLTVYPYASEAEPADAVDRLIRVADALFILPASQWVRRASELVAKAIEAKIPTAATSPIENQGVLVVYGADPFLVGTQAGRLAAQVLRGVPASNLPIETSEFTLRINLRTAHSIGVQISEELLLKAHRIVR